MKKISWLRRLFMGWNSLVEYIKRQDGQGNSEIENELIKVKTDNTHYLNDIKKLEKRLEEDSLFKDKLFKQMNELQAKFERLTNDKESLSEKVNEKKLTLAQKEEEINALKEQIMTHQKNHDDLKKDIAQKLMPLDKINKTFFGSTGNKGKGELGELQLKQVLEKAGIDKNMWVENLVVGKENVEYAIKSGIGEDAKYIPIDSKVIEQGLDYEENKITILDTFPKAVKEQAKKISKYLNKNNTSAYGILVLQNDEIYMELFKEHPALFSQVINEYKVYILSPSSFTQYAWSIGNIIAIYERIHQDEKIYDTMLTTLDSVAKFTNSLKQTHQNFNTAMNSHYNALVNKQTKLIDKLDKNNKINKPKLIENLDLK